MVLSIISFTENGIRLSERISQFQEDLPDISEIQIVTKWNGAQEEKSNFSNNVLPPYEYNRCGEWAKEHMEKKHALLFIGACGIAVRAIAPSVENKLSDSPVLVADELGNFIIPILSGHMGGANELAAALAEKIGAIPVITTATDLNHAFSVDLFAKKNHLAISEKSGIAKVSAKVLQGETLKFSIEPYPPKNPVDVVITTENKNFDSALTLRPKIYIVGVGCRKGKEPEKINAFIHKVLDQYQIPLDQIDALVSIDKKKEEPALLSWSKQNKIPFFTYSADELNEVKGHFSASAFVESQVGVDNVCERAALKACGENGTLLVKKQVSDGMTLAVAKKNWSVNLYET